MAQPRAEPPPRGDDVGDRTGSDGWIGALGAATLVFVGSGAVLVLEILAVRLLAPYVGLTLETTTSIIGAVLAGIAGGAALGGQLADRVDQRRLLVCLLVLGGLLALLIVPLVRWLGPGARGGGDIVAFGLTVIVLVPAAAVLSAITPAVARLRLHDLRQSGRIVGGLSAWATTGAIVGTFGTGFVLVPLLPVSTTVLGVGLALVLAGIALGLRTRRLGSAGLAVFALAAGALGTLTLAVDSPCDKETSYHCVQVQTDASRPNGRTLLLDDVHHSYVDLDDPTLLGFAYTRWIADAIDAKAPRHAAVDAVWIGGGGFTLPRWLAATHQGSRSHVLEVDGEMVDLVRERLGLRLGPDLRVSVGDARMTMRNQPTSSADVVIGDAFGTYSVPWHLATTEWAEEVRRVLRPDGLYVLNVIDYPPLGLLRAESRTLLDVFDDVQLIARPGAEGEPVGGNAVLLAADEALPRAVAGSNGDGAVTYDRSDVARFAEDSERLDDDYAPTDQLLTLP